MRVLNWKNVLRVSGVVRCVWHFANWKNVQFCICSRDSAVLTGYLFQQGPACVHVLNWKNVLRVSGVIRCVRRFANWKNVLCHKMSMCMAFC